MESSDFREIYRDFARFARLIARIFRETEEVILKLVQPENSPLQVMTKLEISRKLPEYHFFRIAENASKSSRKPRKISVNLSEIRRFQEIFINLRAYEGSNGETASRRDPSHRDSSIRARERRRGGRGAVRVRAGVGRRRASRGSAAWLLLRGVRVGRRRRRGGRPCGGVRGWGVSLSPVGIISTCTVPGQPKFAADMAVAPAASPACTCFS